MKIGILTFHSQLNYGGVLQCWALQTALEELGHEVVVIDREFEHQIRSYMAVFNGWGMKQWMKFCVGLILRKPAYLRILRYLRTVRFARNKLNLTPYSFKRWNDAPASLGLDLIVVGSDQVWNAIWNDLSVYTLEEAPPVPAIGYAISLGMTALPPESMKKYVSASRRFSAVSVRESESQTLLKSVGIDAAHVADPTLLTSFPDAKIDVSAGLVCYFIDVGFLGQANIDILENFRRKSGMPVQLFAQKLPQGDFDHKGIKMRFSAGPEEFYKTLASARHIVSDSFHALMFACIFNKPICLVHPGMSQRRDMFARLSEFAAEYVKGKCIYHDLAEVLETITVGIMVEYDYHRIDALKQNSIDWLVRVTGSISK